MIPLARPYIDDNDRKAVLDVLKTDNLSLGPKLREFEEKFAEYLGTKYAVAVSNGTSALHLCLRAAGIKQGDEVITTPLSFVASANSILYEKAKPIFVDIEENSFNIDANKIADAVTKKTKAILPVDIFGLPCKVDMISDIANNHKLKVIEDACEALGAEYKGKKVGTSGFPAVFAFYPNKQITTAEGGMIVTDDKNIAGLCKCLRNQGRSDDGGWLTHNEIGYNYRLNDLSCALGISQLKKIDYILKKRDEVAKKYTKILKNVDGVILPAEQSESKRSWFVYVARLEDGIDRDKVINLLEEQGIAARPYLPSIHLQPAYKKLFKYKEGSYPICEAVSKSTIALPFFIQIRDEEIEKVCDELQNAISQSSR